MYRAGQKVQQKVMNVAREMSKCKHFVGNQSSTPILHKTHINRVSVLKMSISLFSNSCRCQLPEVWPRGMHFQYHVHEDQ